MCGIIQCIITWRMLDRCWRLCVRVCRVEYPVHVFNETDRNQVRGEI